jgi:hypothetical protein
LENFSVFEGQLKTGAEAGAYKKSKVFLEKSSSAVVNVCQDQTIFIFGSVFVGGVYRRPVRLGHICGIFRFRFQNFFGGQSEVRLPRDFQRNSASYLLCPKQKEFLLSFLLWYTEFAPTQ